MSLKFALPYKYFRYEGRKASNWKARLSTVDLTVSIKVVLFCGNAGVIKSGLLIMC